MAGLIPVQFCAPERESLSLDVTEIVIPGADGVFSVLPAHTPLLSTLAPGVVVVFDDAGQEGHYAVSGGFAEVKEDRVVILADTFEQGEKIDIERARAALQRAQERLKKPSDDLDVFRAELALARALARIQAHSRQGY